jgi:hypothetical protein
MKHLVRSFAIVAVVVAVAGWAMAERPAEAVEAPPAKQLPAVDAGVSKAAPAAGEMIAPKLPYRKLAPGVLEPVDAAVSPDETVSTHDITELLYVDSNFDWAKEVSFRHDIWMLAFKFKPMRMISVELPGSRGRMEQKRVWYMVYTVTNSGKVMHPVEDADKTYKLEQVDRPVRFAPVFALEAHRQLIGEQPGFATVYSDKYLPLALAKIRAREDANRVFRSTVEMPRQEIGVGETVWGIATWDDVDPRTVWFSVYVEGLTNAYRWKDDPAKFAAAAKQDSKAPYRELFGKMLRLNFWRPGDEYSMSESQIRYGIPGRPDYEWVWQRVY